MATHVVTRIAPSPTGYLHVGTARTALFNFLFARHHEGTFILRIEDTDRVRSTKTFEEENKESLAWLGLAWDECSRQSERGDRYRELLRKMIDEGKAYISKEPAKDDPGREVEVVRLKNPGTNLTFTDLVRGEITFDTTELKDFVIARSMDDVLYHFAVVVDDMDGEVTHVIRGDDHISNTPRQILIQEALAAPRPKYAHIPLILAPDRTKLSKRKGGAEVAEYRKQGYLPDAIVNFLALLGWNPGTPEEIMPLSRLIELFSLEQIQKGSAIFDIEKLKWMNRSYLHNLPPEKRHEEIMARVPENIRHLPQYSTERMERLISRVLIERLSVFGEIDELNEQGELMYYFAPPEYPTEMLFPKKEAPDAALIQRHLGHVITLLEKEQESLRADRLRDAIMPYADREGRAAVLWPMRVALSGKEKSPDPFTLVEILGKEESLTRLNHAVEHLA